MLVAKLYVDDLTLLVHGAAKFGIDTMAEIINFVGAHLVNSIFMTVSRKKSNTIARAVALIGPDDVRQFTNTSLGCNNSLQV